MNPRASRSAAGPANALQAFLLGTVDFEACLALEQRLVFETSGATDRQITLLVCEHPPTITVGRGGSRAHLHFSPETLASEQLTVRWLNRGGGCMLHLPGQLAVYPIVPLDRCGFTLGDYLNCLQAGLLAALAELNVRGAVRAGWPGIWGRTGQLAACGVSVKNWTTYHGAFLNVDLALRLFRRIDTDPLAKTPMSSLVAERQMAVKMATVREAVVRHLAAALGAERYHLHTSHPLLSRLRNSNRELVERVR
jgi:lipoyl(octanoyl) transferase